MKKNSELLVDLEDSTFKKKTLKKEPTQLIRSEERKMKILNTHSSDQSPKRDDRLKALPE